MTADAETRSIVRASFLPIIAKCPGALHDCGEVTVKMDAGPVTAGGSAVHEVCREIVATSKRPEDLSPYVKRHGCDEDFLGRASWYALKFWEEMRGAFPEPNTEVELKAPFGPYSLAGHTDLLSIAEDVEARVLDWKGGYRTDADAEPQMRGYAYLACESFCLPKAQATVVWLADQTYQSWSWTRGELQQWAADTAERIAQWAGEYTVGDHCRYCPRFFGCPGQTAILRSTIEDLALIDASPGLMELTRLAEIYPAVQNVERLCQAYRDLARNVIAAKGPIPMPEDMQLALVASNRETIDAKAAWSILTQQLTEDELSPAVTISKTKALKAISDKAPRGQKGNAKTAIVEALKAAGAITTKQIQSLRVVRRPPELHPPTQETDQ